MNGQYVQIRCLVILVPVLLTAAVCLSAAEVRVVGTHDAKFNLDGTVVGVYHDGTPLHLQGVAVGSHKLFAKSLMTGELLTFSFIVDETTTSPVEFTAFFAPATPGPSQPAVTSGDVVPGDPDPQGPVVVVRADVDLDVTLVGERNRSYHAGTELRMAGLSAGSHKVYLRNVQTMELAVFTVDVPVGDRRQWVVTPRFVPDDDGDDVPRVRQRRGMLAARTAEELFGRPRSATLAGTPGLAPASRRPTVLLDMRALPGKLPLTLGPEPAMAGVASE